MRTLRRLGFLLGLAATGAASAAIVVFGVGALVRPAQAGPSAQHVTPRPIVPQAPVPARAPPPQTACLPPPEDAQKVARAFLRTAVLRRNTVCSYELVTEQLKQGLTRREWATGNIPVQPFPTDRPGTLHVDVEVSDRAPAQRVVLATMQAADLGTFVFEVILVRRGDQWLVDYVQPKALPPPVPAAG